MDDDDKDLLIVTDPDDVAVNVANNDTSRALRWRTDGYLIALMVISSLCAFLFGYNTGVVSGAILKIKLYFALSSTWLEAIVSVAIGAAAISAFSAGFLCDLIGRRPTLLIASIVYTIGGILMAASYHPVMLIVGRIIVGVGVGISSVTVPMYIAESAPADIRGKLVVINVLFISGGQFMATLIDGAFSYLEIDVGWRFMFGLSVIPSLIAFVGLIFMPESPRWLVFHRRREKARKVLKKIRPPWRSVDAELQSIVADHREHARKMIGCFDLVKKFFTSKSVLLALTVGCGLHLFQQFIGINVVMYYSASIFQMAGFPDQSAIWLAVIPGFVNFFFKLVSLVFIDKLGRRYLIIGSLCGTIVGFSLLSVTFHVSNINSPTSVPFIGDSCVYKNCGSCVGNSECGFCADFDEDLGYYSNGTCIPSSQSNGSFAPKYHPEGKKCVVFGETVTSRTENYSQPFHNGLISPHKEGSGVVLPSHLKRKWFFSTCPENRLGPLAVIALIIYIASSSFGMGPVPWVVTSEIYPTWARSMAASIAIMVNWISNLIVSMTFLTMADNLGQPVTFVVYISLGVLALIFIVFFLPETRGKTLEEVESLFRQPYFMSWHCKKKGSNL